MTPVLIAIAAAATISYGTVTTASLDYIAASATAAASKGSAPESTTRDTITSSPDLGVFICRDVPPEQRPEWAGWATSYRKCEQPAPLTAQEFGIGTMQCISSPAAPADAVMICEGKATRIPARAVGREVALPTPVRAYILKADDDVASISLDGDELYAFGPDFVGPLGHTLEQLTRCDGATTPDLHVWLSASGYVAAARVPVPAQFASSPTGTTPRAGIAVLQFTAPAARIECDSAVVEAQRAEQARRAAEDL